MEMVSPQDHFLSWAREETGKPWVFGLPLTDRTNPQTDVATLAPLTLMDSCELAESRTIPNSLVDLVNSKHLTWTAISAL